MIAIYYIRSIAGVVQDGDGKPPVMNDAGGHPRGSDLPQQTHRFRKHVHDEAKNPSSATSDTVQGGLERRRECARSPGCSRLLSVMPSIGRVLVAGSRVNAASADPGRRHRIAAPDSAGSVEELEKLVGGQARLSQDRRQRAALHYAVPRDDGHAPLPVPVHRMTALGPHMGEAD